MLRSRFFVTLVAAALAAVPLFVGCSNQGEGSRCDTRNNNDDCQDGLTCLSASALNPPQNADVCCPTNRQNATTSTCLIPGGDAAIPNGLPDAGVPPSEASTGDAPASDAPAGDATTE